MTAPRTLPDGIPAPAPSLTADQVRALTGMRDWALARSARARKPRHVLAWRFVAAAVTQYTRENS